MDIDVRRLLSCSQRIDVMTYLFMIKYQIKVTRKMERKKKKKAAENRQFFLE